MKVTTKLTDKSLLNKRTRVVLSIGKCGGKVYRVHIMYRMGYYQYQITEGYTWITAGSLSGEKGLKSVLNILEGKAKSFL